MHVPLSALPTLVQTDRVLLANISYKREVANALDRGAHTLHRTSDVRKSASIKTHKEFTHANELFESILYVDEQYHTVL